MKNGDTVIDIGASIGIFSSKLSELAGPQGHVSAFDPVPRTFSLLTASS